MPAVTYNACANARRCLDPLESHQHDMAFNDAYTVRLGSTRDWSALVDNTVVRVPRNVSVSVPIDRGP